MDEEYSNLSNEVLRRKRVKGMANHLRYKLGRPDDLPDPPVEELDVLIHWLDRIADGESPDEVFLTLWPKRKSIRDKMAKATAEIHDGLPDWEGKESGNLKAAKMFNTTKDAIKKSRTRSKGQKPS
ncbi:MAG: hypothetical protein ACFHXK_12295 [bacterium]